MEGSVYSENRYCSYNVAISTAREQLDRIEDVDVMLSKAKKFADNGNFQLGVFEFYGYISFMLGNYLDAKKANDPDSAYANKGMGLSLSDENFTDPYYDLAVLLYENGKKIQEFYRHKQGPL